MYKLYELYPALEELITDQHALLANVAPEQRSEVWQELSRVWRTHAVGALLVEADVDQYCESLVRSAKVRLELLAAEAARGGFSRFARISNAAPLFDAMAVEAWSIASDIARASPRQWDSVHEYEDDFCYVRLLHGVLLNDSLPVLQEIAIRFEEVLEGQPSTRLDLCQALLTRDRDSLEDAFHQFIADWDTEVAFQTHSLGRNELQFAVDRYVSVEALALLKLSHHLDLDIHGEFEYCPEAACAARVKQ